MRAIRWIVTVLLAVTAVLYFGTFLMQSGSDRKEGPEIICPEEPLEVSVRDADAALLADVTAADPQDGDLTEQVIVGGVSQLVGTDTATVTYLVFDRDDNMASAQRQIRYTDYHRPVIQLTQPLQYASKSEAKLLNRVTVTDAVDGDLSHQARVSTLWATEDERVFSASVTVTNSRNDITSVEVPVIISREPSSILLREQVLYLKQGESFDPLSCVTSSRTGVKVRSEVDTGAAGCYWVWYTNSGGDLSILTVVVE